MSRPVTLHGRREPRVRRLPETAVDFSRYEDLKALNAVIGLTPDPWQADTLRDVLALDQYGRSAATEYGLLVARQNGKGEILLPYELGHLLFWPRPDGKPKVILHTAHEQKTANEAFLKAKRIFENNPALRGELKGGGRIFRAGIEGIMSGNNERGFVMANGNRLLFMTRTGQGGVGFTVDILIVDEAQHTARESMAALLPTTITSPLRQALFTGTVPDFASGDDGEYFEEIRDRGRAGTDPRTGWREYTPDGSQNPDLAETIAWRDPVVWRQSNPGLGYRLGLTEETLTDATRLGREKFIMEHLSVWPDARPPAEVSSNDLDMIAWNNAASRDVRHSDVFAISAMLGPGGGWASVCVASRLSDGRVYVEHRASQPRSLWAADFLKVLKDALPDALVVIDPRNCGPILNRLKTLEVPHMSLSAVEVASAYGQTVELINSGQVVHRGQPELTLSFQHAKPRKVGAYGQTWEQGDPTEPATQAQAATLAIWGVTRQELDLVSSSQHSGQSVFRG